MVSVGRMPGPRADHRGYRSGSINITKVNDFSAFEAQTSRGALKEVSMNRLFIVLVISGAVCVAYFISLQKVAAITKEEENLIIQGLLAEWTKQCEKEHVDSTNSLFPKETGLSICCLTKGQICAIEQDPVLGGGRGADNRGIDNRAGGSDISVSRLCSRAAHCCSEFLEAKSKKMTLQEFMTKGTRKNQESRCDISQ